MDTPTEVNKSFRALLEGARKTLGYAVEGVVLNFTEQVIARMNALGVNRTLLAEKLNHSAAYVTKLLRGASNNFTLESMVKVADALDSEIKIELVPKVPAEHWLEVAKRVQLQSNPESKIWNSIKHRTTPTGTSCPGGCAEVVVSAF